MKKVSLAAVFAVLIFCLFCGSAFAASPTSEPAVPQTTTADPTPMATHAADMAGTSEEGLAALPPSEPSKFAPLSGTSPAGTGSTESQPARDLPLFIMLVAVFVILLLMGVFIMIRLNVITKLAKDKEEYAGRPDPMKQQLYRFMNRTDSALENLNADIQTILKKFDDKYEKPQTPVKEPSPEPIQYKKQTQTSEEILCKLAGDYSTTSAWNQWRSNFEQNSFGIELINDRKPDIGYIPVEWSSAPGLAAVWDNSNGKPQMVFLIPSCNTTRLTHPIIQDCYTIQPKEAPVQPAGYRIIRPALARWENGTYILAQKGHIERN